MTIRNNLAWLHRWMGVCLCIPFLVWFLSGLVLMYCDFPAVSEQSRLNHLAPLEKNAVNISPSEAAEQVQISQPDEARLSSILSRPVYRFQSADRIAVVYADSGEVFHGFREDEARHVAAAWTHLRAEDARLEARQIHEDDQWTVQQHYRMYRPLWKFSWPDGEETYISDVSGEVVQYTTQQSRLGAYFGAIPHWIYITQLRRKAAAWSRLVITLSGAGTISTFLGLFIGFWTYSPNKRYRFRRSPSAIPFSGQMRWHMVLGLMFGFVTFTWVLSGLFSMDPIRWPENGVQQTIEEQLVGANWNGSDFANVATALSELQQNLPVHELSFTYLAGNPVYIARKSPTETALFSVKRSVQILLDQETLKSIVAQAVRPYSITESRLITRYDAYYFDRDNQLRLPALFLRLNDPQQSIFYLDLYSGRVARGYGRWERLDRWLYEGLHDFDIPWLYRHRPLWDIVVILSLSGGVWLSVTGIIIASRRVRMAILFTRN
jgi:uncharacterized iron-regulated membrane protein